MGMKDVDIIKMIEFSLVGFALMASIWASEMTLESVFKEPSVENVVVGGFFVFMLSTIISVCVCAIVEKAKEE